MFQDKFVFSRLTAFLDRNHFNYLTRKYDGKKYVKHLTCWNQLLALMFGQLSNRESLRDLIVALEAHQPKCYHLGLGRKPIAKTTLATANQNRDYRIFEEFAFYMMAQAKEKRAADIFKLGGKVYASLSDGHHRVSFDRIVRVMKQTGHDQPSLYKETSEGGLAKIQR